MYCIVHSMKLVLFSEYSIKSHKFDKQLDSYVDE